MSHWPSGTTTNATGIVIEAADSCLVGGPGASSRNVIAANSANGIELTNGAAATTLLGNYIGSAADGLSPLGNNIGVLIIDATDSQIGGENTGESNLIAHNDSIGVRILAGSGNTVVSNSVHSNGSIGLDLGSDLVTPNDPGDTDSGPNGLQNYPVLDWANSSAPGTIDIRGRLSSAPASLMVPSTSSR